MTEKNLEFLMSNRGNKSKKGNAFVPKKIKVSRRSNSLGQHLFAHLFSRSK